MLDRDVVRGFLEEELEGVEVPKEIDMDELVEVFCRYVEEDYYEWLKDNFNSFFDRGNPDWKWIKGVIEKYLG